MIEITLKDSNFPHQRCLTPYLESDSISWKRDDIRRDINVYTDNFIKSTHCNIPQDGKKNICLLLEPYTNPPWTDIYDYIRTDFEKFDLVITHNISKLGDLIHNRPDKFYYSTKCITTSWLKKDMIDLHKKSKLISMPFTYKNFSEGHRIRHIIYEKYKNLNLIDFYGDGIPGYSGEFRECFLSYKYVIICENTLQNGFNSEKFNDALLTGCIPIYWGSRVIDTNYDSNTILYFSPASVDCVNFNFDESLSLLDSIITRIYENDKYYSLYDSVVKNFNYAYKNKQSEDNLYQILADKKFI